MVKESGARKCSHCGHNGHNSRTCNIENGKGSACLKLFGVKIEKHEEESLKKSLSMGNLTSYCADQINHDSGYLSDGLIHNTRHKAAHERKKGIYIYYFIFPFFFFSNKSL